jgi:nucleotide-binding universal stress UspA family protein
MPAAAEARGRLGLARAMHSEWVMGTIVAATDFSACSRAAVRSAASIARRRSAPLLLLHAVESLNIDSPMAPVSMTDWELEVLTAAERELARLADELRQSEITVETRALLGSPAHSILEIAGQVGADLIVLGTHGRKGAAHLFLGSVAERVVRSSPCPVLVTREQAAAKGGPDAGWDGRRPLRVAIVAEGTSASQSAYDWARTAGQSLIGDVSLLRVYWPPREAAHYGIDDPWPGESGHTELLKVLERDLRRDARALNGAHEPPARFRVASRDAADGLSQDARELGADALVIGVPRHTRYGSPVSPTAVVRAATVPVFCIPETARPVTQQIAPVRSLLDLSESSKAAIVPAYGLVTGGGRVELCYVHALGRPDLIAVGPGAADLAPSERAAIEADLRALIPPEAAAHGIVTHVSVLEAPFADQAIVAAAERLDVDVVAVGSHGRSGVARAVLGSVAEEIARRSPRPVLIVRARPNKT